MEPKLPAPERGPENLPSVYPRGAEYVPQPQNPEQGVERRPEQQERRGEVATATEAARQTLPPVVIAQPQQPADDAATSQPVDDTPLVANDDDLIEREWVDKAKKIIVDTKDDPYKRELEVGKLQADYLKKRYGKELGASE